METRRSFIVEAAQLADELGYHSVQVPEAWGMDSTVVLTEIALATKTIRPMSAILSVWGRTAATIAMNSATLLDVSDGRYVLGIGVSTPALAEGFHDVEYARPASRLECVTKEVANLVGGGRASLDRTTDARPLRLGMDLPHELEIVIAGMGPRMRRIAALHGSGWYPVFIARDQFGAHVDELKRMRSEHGLDPEELTVYGAPLMGLDPDVERGRAAAASNIAWYVVAMGDNYSRLLREQGFTAEVDAVLAANPKPKPGACVTPPEAEILLDQLAVVGPLEQANEGLGAWEEICDVVSVGLPPGIDPDAAFETIRACAPST
ncbi:MAG TPA: LLM class flavin-dependent oxidoreductase [Ilumatobacteraceae bacterium]|nr:LLM class flavin-dependent oxidoreductase [Ilumatobacteraceae bacterium]